MIALALLLALSGDWTTTIGTVTPSVARVEVETADGARGTCTGVVINTDPGYVVTCGHCIRRPKPEAIDLTVNGRHARVEVENQILDLAILSFRAKKEVAVTLAADTPKVGSDVAVIGFPFGVDELMPQFGHVSGYNKDSKLLWLNVDVIFGDSGGLAFDTQGRLVGITSSIFSKGPAHMGAAIPLSAVSDFIEDYLPGAKHPAKPRVP